MPRWIWAAARKPLLTPIQPLSRQKVPLAACQSVVRGANPGWDTNGYQKKRFITDFRETLP